MTIAPLRKVTVVGLRRDKAATLRALQGLGVVHLLPLREVVPEATPPAADAGRALAAFHFLRETPRRRRQVHREAGFDLERVVGRALEIRQGLRELADRAALIRERIVLLGLFGDVTFPPLEALRGRRFWFYVLPVRQRRALDRVELPWAIVGRDNTRLFVVLISREEPPPEVLPVPRSHVGARSLTELQQDLEDAEVALEAAAAEREELTRFLFLLGANLARAEDQAALRRAELMTRDRAELFALQGWAPAARVAEVAAVGEELELALVVEPPARGELPPTLLEARPPFAGATDLTTFYTTPRYDAFDPSPVVFASFALFFAMILSDGGYALLLGVLLAWSWRRLGRSPALLRLRPVALTLVLVSLLWGALAGSWFGIAPPPGHPLAALDLVDLDDFDAMMRLSIGVGVGHIALANLLRVRQAFGGVGMVAPLGWIVALTGGLLVWLGDGSGLPGGLLLGGGLLAVFAGEGLARPVLQRSDWIYRLLDALLGLAGVVRIFGDVLSYLRLFALGLASASLAVTFNQLAGDVQSAAPGIGLFLSLLVLLAGHAINLALAVMSGVVHGLRLNFIEFFGWGLSGEGRPFKAFARREVEI